MGIKDMYNPEPIERFSKHEMTKKLQYIMEHLLNQSHNKMQSRHNVYRKLCKDGGLFVKGPSLVFFYLHPNERYFHTVLRDNMSS
jgi:hypothetical protein